MLRSTFITSLLIPFLLAVFSSQIQAGTPVSSFGSNPGNLNMYKYVPNQLQNQAPLVVILHGCTQNAGAYEQETGWMELADRWGFALVSAEQKNGNNSTSCFNWFESGDINGYGESLSIKQMVDKMKVDYSIDANRVYVAGFSAGAAMTSVLLANWPDVFAGGAILAGVPYNCGTGLTNGFQCMNPGKDLSPSQWGDKVRASTNWSGPWPLLSIWHGDADYTVSGSNAVELTEQWTDVHGIDTIPEVEDTVKGYPHKVWKDNAGNALVESYTITGMGHGHPVDPGPGTDQGGSTGSFTLDKDIFASYFIGRFWGLDQSDSQAPTVTISAPNDGAVVSGVTPVSASATDNQGVDRVEFLINGQLAHTDTTAPYGFEWNTSNTANGDHLLTARAWDISGNSGSSPSISVTVTGGVEDVTPPTVGLTFPNSGDTVSGSVTLSATASDDYGVTQVTFYIDGVSAGNGLPSLTAGPWNMIWNSTSVTDGSHSLEVRAWDAMGNEGTSGLIWISVDQTVSAFMETFSDLNGDGDGLSADKIGWTGSGFSSDGDNHTMGPGPSASIHAMASSGSGCSSGLKTKNTEITVQLGDRPVLNYYRKLNLSARVNMFTTAGFRVTVDGVTVDEVEVTYDNYVESQWTQREVDLSSFANQQVDLGFEVWANSNICMAVTGEAWIDDITLGNTSHASDTTAPVVNITAPANGVTIAGPFEITAVATDNTAVSKVEFHVNGSLAGMDTQAPYSLNLDSANLPNGNYALMALAYDEAGNMGTDNDTSILVDNSGGGSSTTTSNYLNIDSQDGYVKANSGGGSPALGSGFMENTYGLAAGRGTDSKFNRVLLSFDTSNIPDTAEIIQAWLTVSLNSSSGDPWANPTGNALLIDVKTGCFSGNCSIETTDWVAVPDVSDTARIVKWTGGEQNSGDFNAAGMAAINKVGTTQLRLRFSENQTSTNYIFLDNGTAATLTIIWR